LLDMKQTVLLLIAGLVGGFVIATYMQSDGLEAEPFRLEPPAFEPSRVGADPVVAARLDALRAQVEREVTARTALERAVAELAAEVRELQAAMAAPPRAGDAPSEAFDPRPPFMREQGTGPGERGPALERQVERLVAGGFAPARAEWIARRSEELRMAAVQARYDALRAGRDPNTAVAREEQTLRNEIGDDEYERYLTALGRPTTVNVFDVLTSSPAEQAGLLAGDQIRSYGGKRVFDMRELTDLTLEGTPGEPVVLEVVRNGQSLQLVIPRGPIGIAGGGPFRRRMP
jgi:membrane-associated protease RseP (regulator of RpoE activity)